MLFQHMMCNNSKTVSIFSSVEKQPSEHVDVDPLNKRSLLLSFCLRPKAVLLEFGGDQKLKQARKLQATLVRNSAHRLTH